MRAMTPFTPRASQPSRVHRGSGHGTVIERGVIVSNDGVFDIDRALPQAPTRSEPSKAPPVNRVRTVKELLTLERENIERALAQAGGKVSGKSGAAALLGTHPSTLSSRMRSLGVKR
jgi:transcriptional regulator with GAF, ATPase, and Fis domain